MEEHLVCFAQYRACDKNSAGILEQFMGAIWDRVGIGLSYWHARQHSLAELVLGIVLELLKVTVPRDF